MRYSGIQPQYFPRLHYFARILAADIFMIRDDVQFVIKHKYPNGQVDKSYQAHTPIKQSFGRHLLVVPTKHRGFPKLTETKISYDPDWIESHLKTLQFAYHKAANFKNLYPEIEKILNKNDNNLAQLNIETIIWGILHLLGDSAEIDLLLDSLNERLKKQKIFRLKHIRRASESKVLKKAKNLTANEKIIALCQEVGANEDYCGGTGFATYVDHDLFKNQGIKITVQDWKCKEYAQLFPKQEFIANLSIVDLLMNVPQKEAVRIILG